MDSATPPARGPVRANALGAVRAFGVMLGGPAVLLSATIAVAARTAQALRAGRLPRLDAAGVLAGAAAYGCWARPWMRRWGATEAELEGGWSLVVEPDGSDACRLIARSRVPGGIAGTAYGLLLELPHFVMERRMLLEVKRHAEGMS
jgi:hypothetical protein